MEAKRKTFLICPVKGKSPEETAGIVADLEAQGYEVHWPHRDTNQNDDVGYRICQDNRAAIMRADVVHVVWDGLSQGSLFDLGMAFALGKMIVPISLPEPTSHKSFQNMVRMWAAECQTMASQEQEDAGPDYLQKAMAWIEKASDEGVPNEALEAAQAAFSLSMEVRKLRADLKETEASIPHAALDIACFVDELHKQPSLLPEDISRLVMQHIRRRYPEHFEVAHAVA